MSSSSSSSTISWEDQWIQLQDAIQKASREVLSEATTTPAWWRGHGSSSNPDQCQDDGDNDNDPRNRKSISLMDGRPSDENDPNASFHLGMELFGQDDPVLIEQSLHERLEGLKRQVQATVDAMHHSNDPGSRSNRYTPSGTPRKTAPRATMPDVQHELQTKLAFLQECSRARCSLDASQQAWTDESNLSTPTASTVHCDSSHDLPAPVLATRHLIESQKAWNRAEQIVQQYRGRHSDEFATSHPASAASDATAAAEEWILMLDDLGLRLHRQGATLAERLVSMWHGYVHMTNTVATRSIEVRNSCGRLEECYKALLALEEYEHLIHDRSPQCTDHIQSSFALCTWQKLLVSLCRNLYRDVLRPALLNHDKKDAASLMAVTDDPLWTFGEFFQSNDAKLKPSSSASSRGNICRLEWSCKITDDDDHNGIMSNDALSGTEQPDPSTLLSLSLKAWNQVFGFLQRIMCFVADRVLFHNPVLCDFVGQRLLGRPRAWPAELDMQQACGISWHPSRLGKDDHGVLMECLITSLEDSIVPSFLEADQVASTLLRISQELQGFIRPFLKALVDAKLLHDLEDGSLSSSRLGSFVDNVEHKYAEHRRQTLLNKARDLLMQNDYHNTVPVGVDMPVTEEERLGLQDGLAVFQLEKSSISDTASQLMNVCRQTLDEAVNQAETLPSLPSSPFGSLTPILYRSAREMLDLYRAIIPATHGHEICTLPRTSAVFHNDCVYFAYHCLTLGLEYKERFPSSVEGEDGDLRQMILRQTCSFVDMVPLFRNLADKSMGDMLDMQARQLSDLMMDRLSELGASLRFDSTQIAWSEAETALTAALYHVSHLRDAWKTVLSRDMLNRSMCFLADVVFALLLDPILNHTPDISVNAGQFIGSLFRKAIDRMNPLLSTDGKSTSNDRDRTNSRVWGRLAAIASFMDMSLKDIQKALSDGLFRDVTGPELTKLITACFDNSPQRQHLLKMIVASSSASKQMHELVSGSIRL